MRTIFILLISWLVFPLSAQDYQKIPRVDSLLKVSQKKYYQGDIQSTYTVLRDLLDTLEQVETVDVSYYKGLTYLYMCEFNDARKDSLRMSKYLEQATIYYKKGNYPELQSRIALMDATLKATFSQFDEAKKQVYQSLEISKKHQFDRLMIDGYQLLAYISILSKKTDSTQVYMNHLSFEVQDFMDSVLLSKSYYLKGIYQDVILKKNPIKYFIKAYDISPEDAYTRRHFYARFLVVQYKKRKLYKEALRYKDKSYFYLSKIAGKSVGNYLTRLEEKEEEFRVKARLKEVEIERLKERQKIKNQRIFIWIGAFLALVMAIVVIVYYRNYQRQKELTAKLDKHNKMLAKAKAEAEELAKMKSQFSETVSHELRTPLHGIIGLISILESEERFKLSKTGQEYLDSLKFSSDYLLSLINDILQISKIESQKIDLEETPFEIELLIRNLSNSFQFLMDRNKNTFDVQIDEEIPKILLGDAIRLSQVLINLVGNAMKFTKNGSVFLRVATLDKNDQMVKLRVEIEDTGKGIPRIEQKRIFEKFTQIKNQASNLNGTGLGLPIVKELLQLFGSEIHLESEEGKGAKFWFDIEFKISKIQIISNNVLLDEDFISNKKTNQKVLLVDDNQINVIVTQRILEKNHFEVTVCHNGQEAVDELRKNAAYSLVLMDYHMPKMNGDEATKIIRSEGINIPIILLSATDMKSQLQKDDNHGFNDCIIKPYDQYDFLQKVFKYTKYQK
jgi:signal transduction histidine kinase